MRQRFCDEDSPRAFSGFGCEITSGLLPSEAHTPGPGQPCPPRPPDDRCSPCPDATGRSARPSAWSRVWALLLHPCGLVWPKVGVPFFGQGHLHPRAPSLTNFAKHSGLGAAPRTPQGHAGDAEGYSLPPVPKRGSAKNPGSLSPFPRVLTKVGTSGKISRCQSFRLSLKTV